MPPAGGVVAVEGGVDVGLASHRACGDVVVQVVARADEVDRDPGRLEVLPQPVPPGPVAGSNPG